MPAFNRFLRLTWESGNFYYFKMNGTNRFLLVIQGSIIGFQYASHVLWVWRIKSKGVVFLIKTQQWNEILPSSSFTPHEAEHNISSKCFCLLGVSCKFDCFKRQDKGGGVELVGRCLMILQLSWKCLQDIVFPGWKEEAFKIHSPSGIRHHGNDWSMGPT